MKKILYITLLSGVSAFLLTFLITRTFAGSSLSVPAPNRKYLAHETFDNWQYTAYREGNTISIDIALNDTSREGLNAFKIYNNILAQEIVQQEDTLQASIILRQPVPLDYAKQWVKQYGLSNASFRLRFIESDGTRGVLGIATDENGEILSEELNEMLIELNEASPGADLLGVVTIAAEITPTQWAELTRLPEVYVVDLTAQFAKQHFIEQNKNAIPDKNNITITVYNYPIYWYLENSLVSSP